jgi:sulfite exporter TauE/SafE
MVLHPTEGLLLGLSTAGACLAHCLPVVGPALAAGEGFRAGIRFLGEFLVGRLVSCLAVGALLGAVGGTLAPGTAVTLSHLLYIPLGLLLVLHVFRDTKVDHGVCRWLSKNRRWIRTPFALGLVVGAVPCPPFALAAAALFGHASGLGGAVGALEGGAYFLFFFIGTSLPFLPMVLLGLATRAGTVQRLGRFAAVLAGLFFLFTGVEQTLHPPRKEEPAIVRYQDRLSNLLPHADVFSSLIIEAGVPYIEARKVYSKGPSGSEAGSIEVLALCVCTADLSAQHGYGGEVPSLIAVSPRGEVVAFEILADNQETPYYVGAMYGRSFQASYVGRTGKDALCPGVDVDAITGATVTSRAIAASVRESLGRVCRDILGLPGHAHTDAARPLLFYVDLFVLVALFAGAALAYRRGIAGLSAVHVRYGILFVSVAYLGVLRGLHVTGLDFVRLVTGRHPAVSGAPAWFLLVLLFLAVTACWGKLYCSWICPFGAVQELLYRLVPWRLPVSAAVDAKARHIRLGLLGAWPLAAVAVNNVSVLSFEPLAAIFVSPARHGVWVLLLLGTVLAASLVVERFYCKYVCPVGGLVHLLSRGRLAKGTARCGGCHLGRKGCRYLAERGEDYREGDLDGDCIC